MQVLEEEELRVMQQQQREFEQLRNHELAEAQRLEQEELRRKQEKVRPDLSSGPTHSSDAQKEGRESELAPEAGFKSNCKKTSQESETKHLEIVDGPGLLQTDSGDKVEYSSVPLHLQQNEGVRQRS